MKALSLLFLAASTLCLTGCPRFGNKTDPGVNPDQVSGYYSSAPQALTLYTVISGTEHTTEANPSTSTPIEIAEVMTNPVLFVAYKPESRIGVFASTTGVGELLGIFYGTDNVTLDVQYSNDKYAWPGSDTCIRHAGTIGNGKLVKDTPVQIGGHSVSGRAQIAWTRSYNFTGDCAPVFQQMATCYGDLTTCPGSTSTEHKTYQDYVRGFFNPYIDGGAMTIADIANTSAVAFKVSYE